VSTEHGATDHGAGDHGAIDHGAGDHGAIDHGAGAQFGLAARARAAVLATAGEIRAEDVPPAPAWPPDAAPRLGVLAALMASAGAVFAKAARRARG
jgi:hypothetical protein